MDKVRIVKDWFVFSYCPLNTHYVTPFTVNGMRYWSAMHRYQGLKALHFGDYHTHFKIVSHPNPLDLSGLAADISGFDMTEWIQHADTYMLQALQEKFNLNEDARNYLASVSKYNLAYASPNQTYWGTGLAFEDPDNADPTYWKGINRLGRLLDKVKQ